MFATELLDPAVSSHVPVPSALTPGPQTSFLLRLERLANSLHLDGGWHKGRRVWEKQPAPSCLLTARS